MPGTRVRDYFLDMKLLEPGPDGPSQHTPTLIGMPYDIFENVFQKLLQEPSSLNFVLNGSTFTQSYTGSLAFLDNHLPHKEFVNYITTHPEELIKNTKICIQALITDEEDIVSTACISQLWKYLLRHPILRQIKDITLTLSFLKTTTGRQEYKTSQLKKLCGLMWSFRNLRESDDGKLTIRLQAANSTSEDLAPIMSLLRMKVGTTEICESAVMYEHKNHDDTARMNEKDFRKHVMDGAIHGTRLPWHHREYRWESQATLEGGGKRWYRLRRWHKRDPSTDE